MLLYKKHYLLLSLVAQALFLAALVAGSAPGPIYSKAEPKRSPHGSYTNPNTLEVVRRPVCSARDLNPYAAALEIVKEQLALLQRAVKRAAQQLDIFISEKTKESSVSYGLRATDWSLLSETIVFFAHSDYTEKLRVHFNLVDESELSTESYIVNLVDAKSNLDAFDLKIQVMLNLIISAEKTVVVEEEVYQRIFKIINNLIESFRTVVTQEKCLRLLVAL